MQRTDLANGLSSGVQHLKYTITGLEMAAANTTPGTTQAIQLPVNPGGNAIQTPGTTATTINAQNLIVPQGGFIEYVRFKSTAQFAGAGPVSSLTVTLRKTGGGGLTGTPVSGNLCGAVADTGATLAEFTQITSTQHSAFGLEVLITTVGGNVADLTAGSVDVYIRITNISTAASSTSSGV